MSQPAPSAAKPPTPSSRRGIKGFFAETMRELRKVNWPSPAETTRLTGVVLTVCVMLAAILIGLSWICEQVIGILEHGGK